MAERHAFGRSATGCSPASLDDPARREKLDALIARVSHPALYCYFITDEPSAGAFPALGRLVAYLRDATRRVWPTSISSRRMPTTGSSARAATPSRPTGSTCGSTSRSSARAGQLRPLPIRHRRRPRRLFPQPGDDPPGRPGGRRAFLNIVQACSWTPSRRVPRGEEMRYLVYTTLAYGAQEFPTTSTATQGTAAESRWRTERRHRSTMR